MTRALATLAAGATVVAIFGAGCGKKGAPLPPLRPDPARIADLSVRAVDGFLDVSFVAPAANADGTTPSIIDAVEVYALAGTATPTPPATPAAPPPTPPAAPAPTPVTAATIVRPEHLVATLRLVAGTPAAEPAVEARREVRLDLPEPPPEVIRYVAVATGRGRRSAPSAVVEVPIGRRPTAPVGVRATFDDTNIIVEWAGATPAVPAHVDELVADGIAWTRTRRTPEALATSRFTTPLVFGEQRCFEVRHVLVAGRALVEGPASSPACVVPVDRFPPPVPGGLVAIAEDGAVVLTWRAVEAADLSGYLVLRGDGAGETLQPLTPLPIEVRTYRDETVRAGETYTYAIVAVDRSTPANRSAESNRQTVMARQARFR